MGKYDGYLLCTDMDGTMLGDDHQISGRNRAAILRFMAEGGVFTVATGRTPKAIVPFFAEFAPNAPMITHNGAAIFDMHTDTYPYLAQLDDGARAVVDEVLERFPDAGLEIYRGSDIHFCRMNPYVDWHRQVEGLPLLETDYAGLAMPWTKVMFIQSPQETKLVRQYLEQSAYREQYMFVQTSPIFYELLSPQATKGDALFELKKLLGDRIHTAIAVGDQENDLTLLRDADLSYAVGNAVGSAKQAADLVTVSNNEHAIERVIREIPVV